LIDGYPLVEEEGTPPHRHKLTELWHECRRIAEKVWPDGEQLPLDSADRIIVQLERYDPGSFSVR
jgi:hypothetical protein